MKEKECSQKGTHNFKNTWKRKGGKLSLRNKGGVPSIQGWKGGNLRKLLLMEPSVIQLTLKKKRNQNIQEKKEKKTGAGGIRPERGKGGVFPPKNKKRLREHQPESRELHAEQRKAKSNSKGGQTPLCNRLFMAEGTAREQEGRSERRAGILCPPRKKGKRLYHGAIKGLR